MQAAVVVGPWIPRPAPSIGPPTGGHVDESVWDRYSCNAVVWCGNQLATAVAETVILRKINHSFLQTFNTALV
jgi:hypothetical protein